MINKIKIALKYRKLLIESNKTTDSKLVLKAFIQELNHYGYTIIPLSSSNFIHVDLCSVLKIIRGFHPDIRPLFPSFPIVHNLRKVENYDNKIRLMCVTEKELINYILNNPHKTLEELEYLSNNDIIYKKIFEILDNNGKVKKLTRPERRNILCFFEEHLTTAYIKDSSLFVKLGEKLHPGEYKNLFPNCYNFFKRLRGSKNSWEKLRQHSYNTGGILEEANFIKNTDSHEFAIRFKGLMNKAYSKGIEIQLSELLINSGMSCNDLLKLLKTYEILSSLSIYKTLFLGQQFGKTNQNSSEMAKSLRYILISELRKYKNTIKDIKPIDWYKKISVTSLLNPDSMKEFELPEIIDIRFNEEVTVIINNVYFKTNYLCTEPISNFPIEKNWVMIIDNIPIQGLEVTITLNSSQKVNIYLTPKTKIGFVFNNDSKILRWVGEDFKLFCKGRLYSNIPIKQEILDKILKVYTDEPEYSLYDFLKG